MEKSVDLGFLKNLTLGRRQSSGVMHVYPLIGENLTNDLALFEDLKFLKTTNYGEMLFENTSDKPFIIPAGYSIVTKQEAQDHALPHAVFIGPNEEKKCKDACCIQQTQCGYIDGNTLKESFSLLPVSIRRKDFYSIPGNINSRMDFSRLWSHISEFQKNLVLDGYGNLVLFFNRYMDQLATFNAEFEPVDGQIGAIILINDEVVGIEITPNHEYFKVVWNSMIRTSYGAEVLSRSLKSLIPKFKEKELLDLNDAKTVDDIFKGVKAFRNKNSANMFSRLNEIIETEFEKLETIQHMDEAYNQVFFSDRKSKNKSIVGEAFLDKSGKFVYLSMLFPISNTKDESSIGAYLT